MSFYPAGKVDGRKQWMLGLTVPSSAKTGVRAFQVQTGGTTYRLPVAIR
jgi:hypothetical protein